MIICKVLGPVVSTVKHPTYDGEKLLIVQPVSEGLTKVGASFLAVDRVQSGPGDFVLVMQEGNGVRQLFNNPILPIRSIIVGHIDAVTVDAESVPQNKR
ncbi:MAG: hypothetical protein AUK47_13095 [Deltaproteobacteria bacterium CG2_30_63_29]|nr:MAG: hypothetical protein AUK47_13095 [Deltaproteobacteria bacterium CG2_30_63_29]